jgi:hypothetical protein
MTKAALFETFTCLFYLMCRRHHKHDCLCAICVLKRRRKEREENDRIAKGNFGSGGDKHAREFKQEVCILMVYAYVLTFQNIGGNFRAYIMFL